jgi:hypothetical protein
MAGSVPMATLRSDNPPVPQWMERRKNVVRLGYVELDSLFSF